MKQTTKLDIVEHKIINQKHSNNEETSIAKKH